jgi:hypothetical protein
MNTTVFNINNAGLVLTAPFLHHLFQKLEMLHQDEEGRTRLRDDKVSRAVHVLQYLAYGSTSANEDSLALNRIMCGLPIDKVVESTIELTESDRELCNQLLNQMIANWTVVSHMSIPALRETFLQRQGELTISSDGWKLHVQRKTLDVLVDQVPWVISVVSNNWMPHPVFVTW